MVRRDGGPAFARPIGNNGASDYEDRDVSAEEPGMSLRDYFAAAALPGVMQFGASMGAQNNPAAIASYAYQFADALLAERLKVVQS